MSARQNRRYALSRSALRSAARGDLLVPRTRHQLHNRAFSVACPTAWNSFPLNIRSAPTPSTFKNHNISVSCNSLTVSNRVSV